VGDRKLYYVSTEYFDNLPADQSGAVIGLAVGLGVVFVMFLVVLMMYMGLKKAAGKQMTAVGTESEAQKPGGSEVQLMPSEGK
jgi:ABC-type xylose transport system permease subunit